MVWYDVDEVGVVERCLLVFSRLVKMYVRKRLVLAYRRLNVEKIGVR